MLTVVIPAFNEENMILKTAGTTAEILKREQIPYEILFVNDGSSDRTWDRVRDAARKDPAVRGVSFSRNFGKESAIHAGLSEARGECVVVMDCDLQHPPQKIPEMYRLWQQGYEVVEGVKHSRGKENIFHRLSAVIFYSLMGKSVHMDMSRASDFKLMDRKVVDVLAAMPERNAFFRALSSWVGYRTAVVEFDVQEREAGVSKWSVTSLTRYAVRNITSFTSAPMRMVTWAGILMLLFAVILGVQSLVRYFSGHALEGFTTVILLLLLIGSCMMISLGIIGIYIARIYDEVKARPRYLISGRTEENDEDEKDGIQFRSQKYTKTT